MFSMLTLVRLRAGLLEEAEFYNVGDLVELAKRRIADCEMRAAHVRPAASTH